MSPRELQLQVRLDKVERRTREIAAQQVATPLAERLMKRIEGNLLRSPTALSQRLRGIR